jgi:hypothetical protein
LYENIGIGELLDDFKREEDIGEAAKESRKRKETLQHNTQGFSGAGAIHKSGKRVQVYGLSTNWYKNADKWKSQGTGIRMAEYTLERKPRNGKKDKEKEPD